MHWERRAPLTARLCQLWVGHWLSVPHCFLGSFSKVSHQTSGRWLGVGTYLGVVATNVCKKLVNEPAHQGSGRVNPCNELGYNLACRKT